MAILFELVVNFGTGKEAADAAANLVRRASHIAVHGAIVGGITASGVGSTGLPETWLRVAEPLPQWISPS